MNGAVKLPSAEISAKRRALVERATLGQAVAFKFFDDDVNPEDALFAYVQPMLEGNYRLCYGDRYFVERY